MWTALVQGIDWGRLRYRLLEWLLLSDPRRRTTIHGPKGKLIYDWRRRAVRCHLCGQWLTAITPSHVEQAHGYPLDYYRERFDLPPDLPLSAETARRHPHTDVIEWSHVPKPPDDHEIAWRTRWHTRILAMFGFVTIIGPFWAVYTSAYVDAHGRLPGSVFSSATGVGALAGLAVVLSASTATRFCSGLHPLFAFLTVEALLLMVSVSSYMTIAGTLPAALQLSTGVDIAKLTFLTTMAIAWWIARLWRDSDYRTPRAEDVGSNHAAPIRMGPT